MAPDAWRFALFGPGEYSSSSDVLLLKAVSSRFSHRRFESIARGDDVDAADLPDPDILIAEIVEELTAAYGWARGSFAPRAAATVITP